MRLLFNKFSRNKLSYIIFKLKGNIPLDEKEETMVEAIKTHFKKRLAQK